MWAATSPTTTSRTSSPHRTSSSPTRPRCRRRVADDLLQYAGEQVTTGPEAEASASYIDHHLDGIADGATYADLGTVERARQSPPSRKPSPPVTSDEVVAELQAEADAVSRQRQQPLQGRDPAWAAAVDLRLVHDRAHRRHCGRRRLRRGGGDAGAGRARHLPSSATRQRSAVTSTERAGPRPALVGAPCGR